MAQNQYVISKALLENGMIITFEYKKKDGTRSNYQTIIVDKSFDHKMHALSTKETSPNSIGGSLGVISSKRIKESRGLDIPIIQNMESAGTAGYRTFILSKMDKVEVIKWPFPKNIWDVSTPTDIPKTAIEGQKTMDMIESGNEEAMNQPDDVIVQKIKERLQRDFGEGADGED